MDENVVKAGKFIRQWMAEHPVANDLAPMYEAYNSYGREYISQALIGIEPWKYMSYIPNNSFKNISEIEEVNLRSDVSHIGESAFDNCTHLKKIIIPDSVKSIEQSAFFNCIDLRSVFIGNSVKLIEGATFRWCDNLSEVTLSRGITFIDSCAFANCDVLTTIAFNGTKEDWSKITLHPDWCHDSPIEKIICTDGIIEIN